ncbi:MFS transporter [Nocardioides lianchengensis]|uniref:Sugar phosphate permease n=1 Tax=Nocardioides lianchengensis TaxID=1045774 RepID=A0A1G6I9M6_9ACTN|nr:MFS transporter [Nocardioides lianchengensis]NYG13118.1 MFS family permease [Nocardioides lianchengensis]SDC03227.1 Sugar phosphate permease [Nocardioides lianchengensis]
MTASLEKSVGARRLHRAWPVAIITMAALIAAAGFRSSTGALLEPLEEDFGWSRATTSGAVSLNLIVYGLTAPFAAALMERFGVRRVVAASLTLVAAGSGLTLVMTEAWQLWLLWGFAVGVGTGSLALVFGAIVANRWFVRHRGLVVGVFSAASSTGQLVFLPAIAHLADGPGWRWAAGLVTAFALALVPFVLWLMRDQPADVGATPYGAPADWTPPPPVTASRGAAAAALTTLRGVSRSRTFWILFATFWICGWSTNGLIGTHFIPAAHDHGMAQTTSASLLALVGVFDIVGTIASGWLTDRVDPRKLLFAYYGLRGLSLLWVHLLLGPQVHPSLFLFVVFYGLDWVATVPPTVALCRQHFGIERAGVVFGWVFASHMVGAGVAASFAGWVRQANGDYFAAWITAGVLCLLAAGLCLFIPERPDERALNLSAP